MFTIFKRNKLSKGSLVFSIACTLVFSFSSISLAADPFRKRDSRDIGEYTEKAFKTLFFLGDYNKSIEPLKLAEEKESSEPLAYALRASLAYTNKDLNTVNTYALKTQKAAEDILGKDPLRGNLYLGVGHFLEGAYIYEKEGAFGAIQKLQLVFKYFDAAEDIDDRDPELNLIKGYMDLLLAVNLPFSTPEDAIKRFDSYATPEYLVDRGIAVAYRDLKKYDKALTFIDRALNEAPNNPEHYYLKGQILRQAGKKSQNVSQLEEALSHFNKAVEKERQLPSFVVKSLKREIRQTQEKIQELK